MKTSLKLFTLFSLCFILFISCGNDQQAKQQQEANEKETIKMDSVSIDLEETIKTLETKSKELETEVDDILKDFE